MAINISVRDIRINKALSISGHTTVWRKCLYCSQLLFWFAKTKKSAVSQERYDRHTDFQNTNVMEAGAKSVIPKESTVPCPADCSRGNEVGNKAHCNVLRSTKTWYIYVCHWSNFFLIFAHKRWFKDLNDFFFPLEIACQNNTRFCWPHGRHGNCANPSHWYHSPPSIYHVCAFKTLKKPSRFCDRIFFPLSQS